MNLDSDPLDLLVFKWDILQLEKQLVSALWWSNNAMVTLHLYCHVLLLIGQNTLTQTNMQHADIGVFYPSSSTYDWHLSHWNLKNYKLHISKTNKSWSENTFRKTYLVFEQCTWRQIKSLVTANKQAYVLICSVHILETRHFLKTGCIVVHVKCFSVRLSLSTATEYYQ